VEDEEEEEPIGMSSEIRKWSKSDTALTIAAMLITIKIMNRVRLKAFVWLPRICALCLDTH
jgi:hypothetical protein